MGFPSPINETKLTDFGIPESVTRLLPSTPSTGLSIYPVPPWWGYMDGRAAWANPLDQDRTYAQWVFWFLRHAGAWNTPDKNFFSYIG